MGVLSTWAFSCSKSAGGKNENVIAKEANQAAVQWCQVDHLTETWDVVTRLTFNGNELTREFIKLERSEKPITYKSKQVYKWDVSASYYSKTLGATFINDVASIKALDGFDQQKITAEQSLSKNSYISVISSFNPSAALVLTASSLLSNNASQSNYYPCANYSQSLTQQFDERSIIENELIIKRVVGASNHAGLQSIQFPVKEMKSTLNELNKTQWCSWFESLGVSYGSQLLTLTFGSGNLLTNRYSDYGKVIKNSTEEQQLKYINENVSRGTLLLTSDSQNLVAARSLEKSAFSDGVRNFYEIMQDANGVTFLVELKSTDVERVEDVYFKCSMEYVFLSPFYEKFLPQILESEKQNATK